MDTDVRSTGRGQRVLKTVCRPSTFVNQLFAVDVSVVGWVSLGSISYALCAIFLYQLPSARGVGSDAKVDSLAWTYQVQTAAFGAVLLLNVLNLGMRTHLLPFKCNLLLLFINAVAFTTDLLLWRGASPVVLSSAGRAFAPLRYVQWCHSTPTMIYMLALLADCGGWRLATPLACDVAMVLTGLGACYTTGLLKAALTLVSFGTFAVVLCFVYGLFQTTISGDVTPEQRSTLSTVLALLLALWSAFPAVWLAAELHLMGPVTEAVAWGVCDYLAKVVFSSQLWQSNLSGVHLRRDRALEAWETSNRVEAVARLTALLRQRDDLLSTLSHELRTPLAGIVALTGSLCKDVSACSPVATRTLATVRAAAACMLNIVTATLDSFAGHRGDQPGTEPGLMAAAAPDGAAAAAAPSAGALALAMPTAAVDLRPLVETVTSVLRPLAHDGVAVVTDLPDCLPHVAADATRLSQVLYNLVGNAMRFTSQGEVRVSARILMPDGAEAPAELVAAPRKSLEAADGPRSVSSGGGGGCRATGNSNLGLWRRRARRPSSSSVSSSASSSAPMVHLPPGSEVEVIVEDTGVGISEEAIQDLFQPYRAGATHLVSAEQGSGGDSVAAGGGGGGRKERRATPMGGTGLGLYLVRLALRSQGSDITAESVPGLGSRFRFRLPVVTHQHPDRLQRGAAAPSRQPQQLAADGAAPAAAAAAAAASGGSATGGDTEAVAAAAAVAPPAALAAAAAPPLHEAAAPAGPSDPRPMTQSDVDAAGLARPGASAERLLAAEVSHSQPRSLLLQKQRASLDEQRQQRSSLLRPAGKPQPKATSSLTDLPAATTGPAASAAAAVATPVVYAGAAVSASECVPVVLPLPPLLVQSQSPLPPSGPAAVAKRAARTQARRSNYRHLNDGTLQVMSVDDDAINQLVAGQMLASQSWKVIKCMNGPEALKHLKLPIGDGAAAEGTSGSDGGAGGLAAAVAAAAAAEPVVLPDCILLDVMMPGMSGYDVCRRLRQRYSTAQLPVIIVSAKGDAVAVEEAFAAGADDYISKPYKRAEMVARIRAQIRIRDSLLSAATAAAAEDPEGAADADAGAEPAEAAGAPRQVEAPPAARSHAARVAAAAGCRAVGTGTCNASTAPAATAAAAADCSGPLCLCSPRLAVRPLARQTGDARGAASPLSGAWPTPFSPFSPDPRGAASTRPAFHKRHSSVGARDPAALAHRAWELMTEAADGRAGAAPSPLMSPMVVRLGGGGADAPAGNADEDFTGGRQPQVTDMGVGGSSPLPLLTPQASAANALQEVPAPVAASTNAANASAAANAGDAVAGAGGSEPQAALLREVLEEVRRGQRLEAEVAKLNSRLAALQTTCGSLAADRDGWRRQARELRALLAAGFPGPVGAAALAAQPGCASGEGRAGGARGGGLREKLLAIEPLHLDGSSARPRANVRDAAGPNGAAGGGGGGGSDGSSASSVANGGGEGGGAESVEVQLEDLKREAALMRAQLSLALASFSAGGTGGTSGADGVGLGPGGSGSSWLARTRGSGQDLANRYGATLVSPPPPVLTAASHDARGGSATSAGADAAGTARRGPGSVAPQGVQELILATNMSDVSAMSGGGAIPCLHNGAAGVGPGYCNGHGNGHGNGNGNGNGYAAGVADVVARGSPSPARALASPDGGAAVDGGDEAGRARSVTAQVPPHRAASGGDAAPQPATQVALRPHIATSISSDAHTRVDAGLRPAVTTVPAQTPAAVGAAAAVAAAGSPGGGVSGTDPIVGKGGLPTAGWRGGSGDHTVQAPPHNGGAGAQVEMRLPRSGGRAGSASARILRRLCNKGVTSESPQRGNASSPGRKRSSAVPLTE